MPPDMECSPLKPRDVFLHTQAKACIEGGEWYKWDEFRVDYDPESITKDTRLLSTAINSKRKLDSGFRFGKDKTKHKYRTKVADSRF